MPPTWLFEADAFGESAEPIKREIRRQGMGWHVVRENLLAAGVMPAGLDCLACVVACGSFPFARYVQSQTNWRPGAWCNEEALGCAEYYRHFSAFLLNDRHEILPSHTAVARADELFERFASGGQIFVRPSGCQKTFTGCVVTRDRFVDVLGPARYDPRTLVVVAPPRQINREWRLVVGGNEVVAGSQYLLEGELAVSAGAPTNVTTFAETLLDAIAWRPDPIFMLDVCECGDRLFVLEIGAFNCCAFYACDPRAVVAKASQIAEREYPPPNVR